MTETPPYRLVKRDHDIEIRDYDSYIFAQTEVHPDFKNALYSGFIKLFNYFSGNNVKKVKIPMTIPLSEEQIPVPEKIPMTMPVTAEKTTANTYMISFIMPSKYTMETLPEPDDTSITFKQVPAHRAAVIKFNGSLDERLAERKMEELNAWLAKNNLKPRSNFIMAQYDPPWISGFMRHNEILVEI
jgi:DNA gyrase inhibitor GyrI